MATQDAVDIGSRLEPMLDDCLIDRLDGRAELRLHHPVPREIVLVTDKPWEGNMSGGYVTVFRDGDRYRMYYKAHRLILSEGTKDEPHPLAIAYAESRDGIHWERPDLGLFEFEGSRENNIVWEGAGEGQKGIHGFAPFKDPNPDCPPEAQYKAVGGIRAATKDALYAMVSPDGIHWSLMQDEPIITEGKFDSQNLVFRDSFRGEYRAYVRDFRDRCRDIRTAVSADFVNWTTPEWLDYPGAPDDQLYTNQVIPYYRAPHIFVGFPTRYVERDWTPSIEALPEVEHRRLRSSIQKRYGTAVTEGLFMSSRDGRTFQRWGEAFLRPGLRPVGSWAYGDQYQNWGIIETASHIDGAPPEMTVYAGEGYWRGDAVSLRRYTLRVDGFVSLSAPMSGGEVVTKPLQFEGNRLVLNISTSAAGGAKVEIQNADGGPLEGFSLDDCVEVIGDTLDYTVNWANGPDVGKLAGRPVRLRVVLRDADLYSFRFAQS